MAKDAVVALNRLANIPLEEFYREQLREFEKQEVERFAAQGPGWAPLSPRYAEYKATRFPGGGILRASDRLYRSLTTETEDSIRKATDSGMQFGTRVPYANRHNRGTAGMPKREFLRFNLDRVRDQLREFIVRRHNDGGNEATP